MELSFFNFSFHVGDDNWRDKFQKRYESLYKPYVDEGYINIDEYQNMNFLLENWISAMVYQTLYHEIQTHIYEEFEVMFRLPRFTLRSNLSIMRDPLTADPLRMP